MNTMRFSIDLPSALLGVTLLCLAGSASARAKVIDITAAPFSAVGDGQFDNRVALALAFSEAAAGDTVLMPAGDFRIILTKAGLSVPAGVSLLGQGGKSKLLLSTNGKDDEYREFLRPGSEVTLEGLWIERVEKFPLVVLPIFGDLKQVTLRDCRITGNTDQFSGAYCHAIQVGVGTLADLKLLGMEIETCSYGFFQANQATGTVDGVTVDRCRFQRNSSSDLEFNSPKGTMRNVVVKDCVFRDNRSQTPGGGFAVGFANVSKGVVENCQIQNYGSEALHVEDRSKDIVITGNVIVGGSMIQSNGVIMVLSDSKKVRIHRNVIDGRPNENRAHLILVTAGGKQFSNPSEVSVTDNVLVNGSANRVWYLQPGSGPEPTGNHIVPLPKSED